MVTLTLRSLMYLLYNLQVFAVIKCKLMHQTEARYQLDKQAFDEEISFAVTHSVSKAVLCDSYLHIIHLRLILHLLQAYIVV